MKRGSAGGQVMAIRQKIRSREKYYENPNICKNCQSIIKVRENEQPAETRKRKFCNRSCAITFNNKNRKRKTSIKEYIKKTRCLYCYGVHCVCNLTKGEIFSQRPYSSARSAICKNARRIYERSGKPKECEKCKYNKYIEICHIKPVMSFSDTTKIYEINNLKNLSAMCPNCHKEQELNL